MPGIHQAEQHRSAIPGIQATTLFSNCHFPRHSHDQFGIGVLAYGAQRSWSGIGHVDAFAGDVIMVNPGEIHDGESIDSNARRWRMLYFAPVLVFNEVEDEITKRVEIVRPVARDPILAEHFARLFASLTDLQTDCLAREENLLLTLNYALRQHGMARTLSSGFSPSVARAVECMDSAPNRPVFLADLAALSGVSRFQLLRGFAREMGTTPHSYLIQRRVRLAQQLLVNGETPVQAAVQSGFADQSHMTRAFVRQLGITPSRYRAAIT